MQELILALILIGGFVAGVLNTLAGGGSLITLPLLIFSGLPADVANGTNRVAIVLQNIGGLAGFRRHGLRVGREAWILLAPSMVGAILGAKLAVDMDETLMRRAIGVMLVLMLVPILRSARPGAPRPAEGMRPSWWIWPAYFLVGVYGGFLQAGVGFFYLALLVGVQGLDLVRANLIKVFLILAYSVVALALFAAEGKVAPLQGLVLAAGNMAGGWVGAHMAVRKGEKLIRAVLVVAVLASAIKLTGLLDLFGGWLAGGGGR